MLNYQVRCRMKKGDTNLNIQEFQGLFEFVTAKQLSGASSIK
jgi:hypothetical protein